jgi:hypothetical protein
MTNPFAVMSLHAAEAYSKLAAETIQPKSILYALGTTLFATILYKSIHHRVQGTSNFFYIISLPFKYFYHKFQISREIKDSVVLFEDKYFKEYDEWLATTNTSQEDPTPSNSIVDSKEEAHKKERLENMYYITVTDRINDYYGDVMMCYDHATLSFAYYARTGNIPYKYLETISRKYMIETNAPREIHVDIREEYKKAKDRTNAGRAAASTANNNTTATHQDPSEEDETPFVKLKSYNTASNLNLHTNTNETKERTHKFASSMNDKNQDTSSSSSTATVVIRENANRYSYRGKLSDFEEHHKIFLADRRNTAVAAASAAVNSTTTSSYAEYKKQMRRSAL